MALETLTFSAQPTRRTGLWRCWHAAAGGGEALQLCVGALVWRGVWALGRRLGGRRGALVGFCSSGRRRSWSRSSRRPMAIFATLFALAVARWRSLRDHGRHRGAGAAALALVGGLLVKSSFRVVAGLLAAIVAVAWRDWGRRLNLSGRGAS
ncbi:MAG: hypothetical protein U0232_04160 [Thermomicrobiales bacterium]